MPWRIRYPRYGGQTKVQLVVRIPYPCPLVVPSEDSSLARDCHPYVEEGTALSHARGGCREGLCWFLVRGMGILAQIQALWLFFRLQEQLY